MAGAKADINLFMLADLLNRVIDELELSIPPSEAERDLRSAVAMCRRAVEGEFSSRYVARWAHRYIGHDGPVEVQELVNLDDYYDDADIGLLSVSDLNDATRQVVADLAARRWISP